MVSNKEKLFNNIVKKVVDNINTFVMTNEELESELKKIPEDKLKDKLIVINNSYFFRHDIKTNKNEKYLSFYYNNNEITKDDCFIIKDYSKRKKDYLILEKENNTNLVPIEKAIEEEISELGYVIFVLISEINNNINFKEDIESKDFKEVIFNSTFDDKVLIKGETILINSFEIEEECFC